MTRETAIPSAWATHVGGAAALVQYRGSNQLRSRLARGLFGFVRRSIVSRPVLVGFESHLTVNFDRF